MTGHEVHHASPAELIQPAVNFVLFSGLMVYVLSGPLRTYFRERTAKIRSALEAGRRAKQDAEALRAQLERDTADLPRVRAELVAELRETAERQRDLLLRQARDTGERLRNDARVAAVQESAAAHSVLREDLAARAVREASRLVRDAITPDDQSRFVRDFVQSARTL
jgi:F-type H+-transporting ATPase subunit b